MSADPANTRARHLAAVVVNFGTPADTRLAVRSLIESDRLVRHIIVVDHDAPSALENGGEEWGRRVRCLPQGRNLGFAGGANVGVHAALDEGADAVLLLNSDAVVAPDCLGRLDDELRGSIGVGIVGPLILDRADHATVASAGIDYDPRTGRMRERHVGERRAQGDVSSGPRTAVSGCAMLVAREVWERVGFFDERYFFGFEDIDLCLRARASGFRVGLVEPALAYHAGGGTLAPTSPRRFYFAARNHLLLARDHRPPGLLGHLARPPFVAALNMAHALTAPGGSTLGKVQATLRGTADYVVRRFGEAPF